MRLRQAAGGRPMPFPIILSALFFCILSSNAVAEEIDLINRPINAAGLTGLVSTTMPRPCRTGRSRQA